MKKKLSILLSTLLFFSVFSFVSPKAENISNEIDIDTAKNIATAFVWENQGVMDIDFDNGLAISNVTEMYDFNEEISAYLVELENEDGHPSGYVIVGSRASNQQIIEFSFEGQADFLYNAVSSVQDEKIDDISDVKLYYNGSLDYYFEDESNSDSTLYHIGSDTVTEIEEDAIPEPTQNIELGESSIWIDQAEEVSDILGYSGEGSTLGSGSVIITNPGQYEKGSSSGGFVYVSGYDKTYVTTSSFPAYDNHCGPVAGTNLMIYWAKRNPTKYAGLLLKNNNSTTFLDLYDKMKTGIYDTTYMDYFAGGLRQYFSNNSLGADISYYSPANSTWSRIDTEIRASYPVPLLLNGHRVYGNHFVLGLGTAVYTYSDGTSSKYVRIADCWNSSASRFINYSLGYTSGGGISMIRVRPY